MKASEPIIRTLNAVCLLNKQSRWERRNWACMYVLLCILHVLLCKTKFFIFTRGGPYMIPKCWQHQWTDWVFELGFIVHHINIVYLVHLGHSKWICRSRRLPAQGCILPPCSQGHSQGGMLVQQKGKTPQSRWYFSLESVWNLTVLYTVTFIM